MQLTNQQVLVSIALMTGAIILSWIVRRWWTAAIPVIALLGLYAFVGRDAWYESMPEEWQAALYLGLVGGAIGSLLVVLVNPLRRRADTANSRAPDTQRSSTRRRRRSRWAARPPTPSRTSEPK